MARRDQGDDAVRITTAAAGREEDIAKRQRNYLISMSIRVVCFLAAVALFDGWMRWVLMAAAIFLPYVAVLFANGEDQRQEPFDLAGPTATELPPSSRRDELS